MTGGTALFTFSLRFRALLLVLVLLCTPAFSLAEGEAFVPLTHSRTVWNGETLVVTGERAMVDHAYLAQVNPDYAGWLYQEETGLSEPIMQCEKSWYLQRGFDGVKLNNKGSICLDKSASLSDQHIVLQGLGRSESCFETLNGYTNPDYLAANPSLRLLTPKGDWLASVFAVIPTSQHKDAVWTPPAVRSEFDAWLSSMLEQSLVQADASAMPVFDDRLLILLVDNASSRRNVILARLSPLLYAAQEARDLNKVGLDRRETISGVVEAGPFGQMQYYAQNDPLWNLMRYESSHNSTYRTFGDGGCAPTAAAVALANVVKAEDLPLLAQHMLEPLGTLFCECSVNRVYCTHRHPPYQLRTAEEYLRYLPVALADFAAGNNPEGIRFRRTGSPGSSILFLDLICDIFGIERTTVKDLDEGLKLMKEKNGQGLMVCCALRHSPYTNNSHYVVMVGVDEEYFYVLDPFCRTDYSTTDKRELLECLSPGVTRIRLDKSYYADLSPVYYMERID